MANNKYAESGASYSELLATRIDKVTADALRKHAEQTGKGNAEIIREAIADYVRRQLTGEENPSEATHEITTDFIDKNLPRRSQMSVEERVAFIAEYGKDSYLRLPWD